MAVASLNRVQTTTTIKLMPKLVDTVLNSNVLFTRVVGAAKKWKGERMRFPIKVTKNATGTSFAGFDTFSTNATDPFINLEYTPAFYQISVPLPLDELSINQVDETKVIDLAGAVVKSSAEDMADALGTIFYADGTGNGSKDPLGLAAIVDDGTSVATIGGLSRATYTTLKSTVTASSGVISLAKMSTLYNAITSGSQKPNFGVTTPTVFSLYEQLLQPQERLAKSVEMIKRPGMMSKVGQGFQNGTGYTGLFFKGFPIVADEKCTAGALIFLNDEYLDWYALPVAMGKPVPYKSTDIEGNDYSDVEGLGFSWSGFVMPANQAAVVGHVYFGGQLITQNPKRHGKLTGITST